MEIDYPPTNSFTTRSNCSLPSTLDDIIGMLRVREAYRLMVEKKEFNKQNLIRAADKIYFIPESTPLNTQLIKFQRNNEKVGIIVDEYGDIQGLVTVEEIVGDFTTSMSPSLAEEALPQTDGSVLIDGTANIREINKAFDWHLPVDDARTINGLLLEELGDIPMLNTEILIGKYRFIVLAINGNVIKQVRAMPIDLPYDRTKTILAIILAAFYRLFYDDNCVNFSFDNISSLFLLTTMPLSITLRAIC